MGGICSKSCGMRKNDYEENESKYSGVPVATPSKTQGVKQNVKNDPKDKQSLSERVLGSKRMQQIKSIVGGTPGAQKPPQWPTWLTSVASEAVQGWVPRSADSYEMLNKIGQGTYSSVYKARDLQNDRIVAIKKVRFVNMDPESVRFMAREICILRRLDHPNCMKLQALVTSKYSGSLYLVFDYMEHDLVGLLQNSREKKFTEPQIKCYMQQLLRGMEHCHNRGVLHRDLKGSNILLDNNGILKIGDFGLAARFEPGQKEPLTSRVVTLWYRAPELLFGSTSYGAAIDMWSAGCILAELYTGRPIMPGRTEVEQIHKIFKLCGSPSDEYWMKSRLPHATSFKPKHAYTRRVSELFQQHMPPSALSLLDTLLAMDPEKRGSATSALASEFFTTDPLPCAPSELPEYPPSKEFDARYRAEEARRRKAENMKGHVPDSVRVGVVEWKAQSKAQVKARNYNPQGENRIGKKGFSYSNSEIHQSAAAAGYSKNLNDDACTSLRMGALRIDPAAKLPMSNMHQAADPANAGKKVNREFSGPLMPGGRTDDMLKVHERHVIEVVRRARLNKSRLA